MPRLIEERGHGRIEEGTGRAAVVIDWPNERHLHSQNMSGIAAITAKRLVGKTGQTFVAAHFARTSLPACPAAILALCARSALPFVREYGSDAIAYSATIAPSAVASLKSP